MGRNSYLLEKCGYQPFLKLPNPQNSSLNVSNPYIAEAEK